tara:strand:+ start:102 stop:719 length:618 start_codon:yes stop_codon:yes gene_type:complete
MGKQEYKLSSTVSVFWDGSQWTTANGTALRQSQVQSVVAKIDENNIVPTPVVNTTNEDLVAVGLQGEIDAEKGELPSELAVGSRPRWGSPEFEAAVQTEHDKKKKAAEAAIAGLKATGRWSQFGEDDLPSVRDYVRFATRHEDHIIEGISEEPYARNIGKSLTDFDHDSPGGKELQRMKKDQYEREKAGKVKVRTAPIAAESETN